MGSSFVIKNLAESIKNASDKIRSIADLTSKSYFNIIYQTINSNTEKPTDPINICYILINETIIYKNSYEYDNKPEAECINLRTAIIEKIDPIFKHLATLEETERLSKLNNLLKFLSYLINDLSTNIRAYICEYINSIKTIFLNYIANRDEIEFCNKLLELYFSILFEQKKEAAFKDLIKLYRYNSDIFDHISNCLAEKERALLLSDYTINHKGYFCELYSYYYEYYIRCGKDDDAYNMLLSMTKTCYLWYEEYCRILNTKESQLNINYTINLLKPIDHTIDDIDELKQGISVHVAQAQKAIIDDIFGDESEVKYKILALAFDNIRDKNGKVKNRADIDKMFMRWQRYLDVYDLRKKAYSWMEISKKLEHMKKYKSVPSSVNDVKKDFKEAERLILSASNLTFPY